MTLQLFWTNIQRVFSGIQKTKINNPQTIKTEFILLTVRRISLFKADNNLLLNADKLPIPHSTLFPMLKPRQLIRYRDRG